MRFRRLLRHDPAPENSVLSVGCEHEAGARDLVTGGKKQPNSDSGSNNFYGRERHETVIETTKETTGYRRTWQPRID